MVQKSILPVFILVCLFSTVVMLAILSMNPFSELLRLRSPVSIVVPTSTDTTHPTRKSTVLLIYTGFFGDMEWFKFDDDCSLTWSRKSKCTKDLIDLTYDKRRFNESHFVIFHARDMPNLDHLKTILKDKPSSQFWIYFVLESPNATPNTAPFKGMFDLTFTYRVDSHFWSPYAAYEEMPVTMPSHQNFSIGKDKLVAWIVSNCQPQLRKSFVHELQKYIAVDVFGSCSGEFGQSRACPRETCQGIIKQYKFYLSFENALCEDYITEKYWRHLGKP